MIEPGDVMIRNLPGDEFLVVNAVTLKTFEGPFTTFADALATARLFVGPSGTIWQENHDDRGRPFGPPIRIA